MRCPECDEVLLPSSEKCKCGWKKPHVRKSNHWCAYHGCNKPGSMTSTTKANENTKWYCGEHFIT